MRTEGSPAVRDSIRSWGFFGKRHAAPDEQGQSARQRQTFSFAKHINDSHLIRPSMTKGVFEF
jgi:hypothetical protein